MRILQREVIISERSKLDERSAFDSYTRSPRICALFSLFSNEKPQRDRNGFFRASRSSLQNIDVNFLFTQGLLITFQTNIIQGKWRQPHFANSWYFLSGFGLELKSAGRWGFSHYCI